ncbi:unnamed protein product [Phyllotreta striolata]|uniref:Uncharacterized protein n=1 Tax=Phyllotreta striolata TaxID=444603 RepID=A0A9N9TZR3_PHYSR|nr:unnamed protein product [Phyllotreta striolata]
MVQWLFVLILTVIVPWESTAITNKRPSTEQSAGVRYFRHIPAGPTSGPLANWEIGLREAIHQALLREGYWEPNLRQRLNGAQLIGRQDAARTFGDVVVLARGQLYAAHGGDFLLLQDPYRNDCDDCHNPRRCERHDCRPYAPRNKEILVALWTVKRLRHRDPDGTRFELEYIVSPVNEANDQIIMRRDRFNYAIAGHVFVIRSSETSKYYPEYYNRKIVQTQFKPEVVLGVDAEGHKHVLYSYPGFLTSAPQLNEITTTLPATSTTIQVQANLTKEAELYKKLLEILASKTDQNRNNEGPHRFSFNRLDDGNSPVLTTQSPVETKPSAGNENTETTVHYFMPTGEEVLLTEIASSTTAMIPPTTISSTPKPFSPSTPSTTPRFTKFVTKPRFKLTTTNKPTKSPGFYNIYNRKPKPFATKTSKTPLTSTTTTTTAPTTQSTTKSTTTSTTLSTTTSTTLSTTKSTTHLTTTSTSSASTHPEQSTTESSPQILSKALPDTPQETLTSPMTISEAVASITPSITIVTSTEPNELTIIDSLPQMEPTEAMRPSTELTNQPTTPEFTTTVSNQPIGTETTINFPATNATVPTTETSLLSTLSSTSSTTSSTKTTSTTTSSDFLTESEPYKGPLYVGTVRNDYNLDDIFGTTKSTLKPSTSTRETRTESDISRQLFADKPKIIFSDFYEASTDGETERVTSQSYETSVSYQVNKRNQPEYTTARAKTKQKAVEYKSNASKLLHYKPTKSPAVSNNNNTDYVTHKAEYPDETSTKNSMETTKEMFDRAALVLISHAKSLEFLNKPENNTIRSKYRRRKTYVPRSRTTKKPQRRKSN